ncbi:hypothetical protein BDN72DRAFT_965967 [Pluteus cervinus]|uniref:Uncharacterized protein n=1 Tax=Pluteus cervinus TaxID=181527 RepID=A0ACD3A2T1_9AGAR|nr:hypothetical protein BDN72DRAFT_965967 [Pluteus cervinus]
MLSSLRLASRSFKLPSSAKLSPVWTHKAFSTSIRRPLPQFHYKYERFGNRKTGRGHQLELGAKVGAGIVVLGGVYYVLHLEQVPETGRWRFMNTSPKYEAELGELLRRQSYEEFKDKILPPDHPYVRQIRHVASKIITSANLGYVTGDGPVLTAPSPDPGSWDPDSQVSAARRSAREWEVLVVNDLNIVNAQATPGLVVVYTGILPVCQDEQGLASVLSHEIGHVVARHTAERVSSQTVVIILSLLMQSLGFDWGLSSLINNLFLELPNSRKQEQEADIIGLRLMANACYDPRAAPEMFARLGKVEGRRGNSFEFMRTHPLSENRVKYLQELLPEAFSILAANPECTSLAERMQGFREATGERLVKVTRDMLKDL